MLTASVARDNKHHKAGLKFTSIFQQHGTLTQICLLGLFKKKKD